MKYKNGKVERLVYESNLLEEKFWDKFYQEDSMANDLLDMSAKIIRLKNRLIKEFEEEKEVICKSVNHGISFTGEYDIEFNMYCPNCDMVVGDYESEELWSNYCPDCGQKLKYTKENE